MERTHLVLAAVLTTGLVIAASALALRFLLPAGPPETSRSPVGLAFDLTHVGGKPEMNTTEVWVARITHVETNESLSNYKAALLRNGTVLVEPTAVKPGRLGSTIRPVFEFFDSGTFCSPTPCPPPEGPDGNLSVDDYFRISSPDSGTAYTVRVLWTATGEIVGEVVIHT